MRIISVETTDLFLRTVHYLHSKNLKIKIPIRDMNDFIFELSDDSK